MSNDDLAQDMISGFAHYTTADELGHDDTADAPATSPATITTVSSVECVMFTIGLTSGGVATTYAAGC